MPYVNNNGINIYYETEGQGFPLVMLHGLTGNVNQWHEFGYSAELKTDFRLVLIDARGHGKSDKPYLPAEYAPELLVKDIIAVLNALYIKKANFFGYSMGAWIGFNAIINQTCPQFNRFVLGGFASGFQNSQKQFLLWMKGIMENGIKEGMATAITELEKISGPPSTPWKPEMLAIDPRAISACIEAMLTNTYEYEERLPMVQIPVLMFAGEADPFYLGAKICATQMANASFFSLPNLSHSEALMRSGLVLPQIKQFLLEAGK